MQKASDEHLTSVVTGPGMIMNGKVVNKMTRITNFQTGFGTYDNMALAQPTAWLFGPPVPGNTKWDENKIAWLGGVKPITYESSVTLKSDGTWAWNDTGAGIKASGKFDQLNK
jgi:hypothetical protein